MSGALQAVYRNLRSFGEPAPTTIGQAYGGGYYAGQISTAGNGVADFYLVIGPASTAESNSKKWQTARTNTTGTSSVIDGPTNSNNMNDASHPAAQFCKAVTAGSFSDWYMPAKNELEICYYNFKPTTFVNNTASGTNTNAVPSRGSNYTTTVPAQTSVALFQSPTGAQKFDTVNFYWSSTQYGSGDGNIANFLNGEQTGYDKTYSLNVRAVRRVAV